MFYVKQKEYKGGIGSGRYPKGSGKKNAKKYYVRNLPKLDTTNSSGDVSLDGYGVSRGKDAQKALVNFTNSKPKRSNSSSGSQAIKSYTSKGHISMNGHLISNGTDYRDKMTMLNIKAMDWSMTDTITEPTVLTRCVSGQHPLARALRAGKNPIDSVYTEPNYGSTSLDADFQFGMKPDVRIQIKVPAGTKGISTHKFSGYPEEAEFILPRNCSYKVVGYKPRDGDNLPTFVVELVDNGIMTEF